MTFEYKIQKLWDSDTPTDKPIINIKLTKHQTEGLLIQIDAPFYNDPKLPPTTTPGSTDQLWDYEVVELFFLGQDSNYLEIELAPRGHYLLLQLNQLNGSRTVTRQSLPLNHYKTEILGDRWTGEAIVPFDYFPEKVEKFNAYAIHKSDPNRVYMALYPVPKGKYDCPNFHRLAYFQPIGSLFK